MSLLNQLYFRLSSTLNRYWLANRSPGEKLLNQKKGFSGEQSAYQYLRRHGYKIVARNYRKRFGEVDLIGWDGDTLAFVEVKSRTGQERGRPEEAVHKSKQRQICRVAREYRNRHRFSDVKYRFDVVSITGVGEQQHLVLLKDAFCDRRW